MTSPSLTEIPIIATLPFTDTSFAFIKFSQNLLEPIPDLARNFFAIFQTLIKQLEKEYLLLEFLNPEGQVNLISFLNLNHLRNLWL